MKARTTLAAATALAVLALCATAAAAPDSGSIAGLTSPSVLTMIAGTGDDAFSTMSLSPVDPSGHPTQHYGPYTSTSPDSSTCGNDWAEDTFDRDFTVRGDDGRGAVQERQLRHDGRAEPGSVRLVGRLRARHRRRRPYRQHARVLRRSRASGCRPRSSPYCDAVASSNADCTTATFVNTHFTPCYPFTCTVTTFFDHYSAGDQGLAVHEWKNASCDRGGNHGDIADLVGPAPPPTPCID